MTTFYDSKTTSQPLVDEVFETIKITLPTLRVWGPKGTPVVDHEWIDTLILR